MRQCICIAGVCAALWTGVTAADAGGVEDRLAMPQARSGAGAFGLRLDTGDGVTRLWQDPSRDLIDASFDMVSAVCLDCGGACPPVTRTLQVVLEANQPVADSYGVVGLTSRNLGITGVNQDTSLPLVAGERVTITITAEVLACHTWSNLWFSMCSVTPVAPSCGCPTPSLIHEFVGGADDGASPLSQTLTLGGSTLYGMTSRGGDSNWGCVFSIGVDGTGFTLLHEFASGAEDGSYPYGGLLLDGSILYGMTASGGDANQGVIFSIGTDGTGFTLLHEFSFAGTDGQNPYGDLVLDGSTLYGMTPYGGPSGLGVVFSIGTDGSGYTHLHEFSGGVDDGSHPEGSLLLDGSTLYGMTTEGGDSDLGVVFAIATGGGGYTHLHEFVGGLDGGANPSGSLTLVGSSLFGLTEYGGFGSNGVLFSLGTGGSGFTVHHKFSVLTDDGESPAGSLALAGSKLFGMTWLGGLATDGVLFSIGTDGSGYGVLHRFVGGVDDGGRPRYGKPAVAGCTVFGMTSSGGDLGRGVIFRQE